VESSGLLDARGLGGIGAIFQVSDAVTSKFLVPAVLPGGPPQPCPEVLTENEAIRYLRLDCIGVKNPGDTLAYYRRKGLLRGTQIGKSVRFRRVELERFLEQLTATNPR
jgi:hypothetical protein